MSLNTDLLDLTLQLSSIAQDDFEEASILASRAKEYTDDFQKGSISKNEYQDLLKDLEVEKMVAISSTEMQVKIAFQSIVSNLLKIVESIPIK